MNRADLLRRLAQNLREAAANHQALAEILDVLARDEPAAPPAPTAAPSTVNAVDYLLNAGIAKGRGHCATAGSPVPSNRACVGSHRPRHSTGFKK